MNHRNYYNIPEFRILKNPEFRNNPENFHPWIWLIFGTYSSQENSVNCWILVAYIGKNTHLYGIRNGARCGDMFALHLPFYSV